MTIAILSDDRLYRHLLGMLLAEEDYQAIVSMTGADAYALVRTAQPNLVILDVRAGSPDGWLTLELLRHDPVTAHIPVIACATNTLLSRAAAAQLRQLSSRQIDTPFLLDEFLAVVRTALAAGDELDLHERTVG